MLFVIELKARRVEVAGIVHQPDGRWMKQVARNLTDSVGGFLQGSRYLIHDRDPLFTEEFRDLLRPAGVTAVKLPARSPNLNAYAERFVRSIRSECLSQIIPLGADHLRQAVQEFAEQEFAEHYHSERNHQGLGNRFIAEDARLDAFETREWALVFADGADHRLGVPSSDSGPTPDPDELHLHWDMLEIRDGCQLALEGGPHRALYVGGLVVDSVEQIKSDGASLYYDRNHPESAWMVGRSVDLPGGGALAPIQACLAQPGIDSDGDCFPDDIDNCPAHHQAGLGDRDANGIGDECECGDQTGDGLVDVNDVLAINRVVFGLEKPSSLCDANNDGLCSIEDVLAANAKLFGSPAYCERHPPPHS